MCTYLISYLSDICCRQVGLSKKIFLLIHLIINYLVFYRYSIEAHLVHYNKKYGDFASAFNKPDGLAVLAFFFEANDNLENKDFSEFANAVKKIVRKNASVSISSGQYIFS